MAVVVIGKITEELCHLTVIFTFLFISFYLFINIYCYKRVEYLYTYDDHLCPQVNIGESINYSELKTERSIDSVLLVFKDDPIIGAALNVNIKKNQNISILERSTSLIRKIYNIKKSKYDFKFGHLTINSSDDMIISTRTLYYPNNHITNISRKKDMNVCSTVNPRQSAYPPTRNDSNNDLLKISIHYNNNHPQPLIDRKKVHNMKPCLVNKKPSTHNANNSINKDLEETYNTSLLKCNRKHSRKIKFR